MATRLSKSNPSIFEQMLRWVETISHQRVYPNGLKELILSVERGISDINDTKVTEAVTKIASTIFAALTSDTPSASKLRGFYIYFLSVFELLCLSALKEIPIKSLAKRLLQDFKQMKNDSTKGIAWLAGILDPADLEILSRIFLADYDRLQDSSTFLSAMATGDYFRKALILSSNRGILDGPKILGYFRQLSGRTRSADSPSGSTFLAPALSRQARGRKTGVIQPWSITVTFQGQTVAASRIANSLLLISASIESVTGTMVVIENAGVGSFWVKLKAVFKTVLAQSQVRSILAAARDALLSSMKRVSTEQQLREAEKEKIVQETVGIKNQTLGKPADLQREEYELDIQLKKLEVAKRSLELVEKAVSVFEKGLRAGSPVEIRINDLPYVSFDGKTASGGVDLDEIASAAERKARLKGEEEPD